MKKDTLASTTQKKELLKHIAKFVHDIRTPLFGLTINSEDATELLVSLLPNTNLEAESKPTKNRTELSEEQQLIRSIRTIEAYAKTTDEIVSEFWAQTLSLLDDSASIVSTQSIVPVPTQTQTQAKHTEESKKVLLVDDDEFSQQVGLEMLRELGFQVSIANNGVQALQLLESDSFQLILMDCRLPELDGWETTTEIRQKQQNTTIPIIGLTASLDDNDYKRAIEVGMNDCQSKPLTIDALERIVDIYAS